MRGQAHVVFQDIPDSTSAMRALQGFSLFDKAIKIEFARKKSASVLRMEKAVQERINARRGITSSDNTDSNNTGNTGGNKRSAGDVAAVDANGDAEHAQKKQKKVQQDGADEEDMEIEEDAEEQEPEGEVEEDEVPNRTLFIFSPLAP